MNEHPVGDRPRRRRQPQPFVLFLGPLLREDVPGLCELLERVLAVQEPIPIVCDVGALTEPDIATLEALLRLQLTARRHGQRLRLRHANRRLRHLLILTGLYEVLPAVAGE